MTQPFPLIEAALRELIETKMPDAVGKVGGDLSYESTQDFYIWIGLIPGGSTNRTSGTWYVDIDVFGTNYSATMARALALEAHLVGPLHRTSVMRIDNCTQSQGPAERPWDDESVYRIGAVYTLTARRSG